MSCKHDNDWLVDCGSKGLACWLCNSLLDQKSLRQFLGLRWACPVCDREAHELSLLVIHHDHFHDAIFPVVGPAGRNAVPLETFRRTVICDECNHLDVLVKIAVPKLPAWFSMAPSDMRRVRKPEGGVNTNEIVQVWNECRIGVYADVLRALSTKGYDPIAMRQSLAEYKTPNRQKRERDASIKEAIGRLRRENERFKALYAAPGNDAALVRILGPTWIERGWLDTFVHIYHRRHGDREFIDRPAEFGAGQYKNWLALIASGDEQEAREMRQRCVDWARQNMPEPEIISGDEFVDWAACEGGWEG